MRTMILQGLSTLNRLHYWNFVTKFFYYRKKYKNLYGKLTKEIKSADKVDIGKDIDRTFPHLEHFKKGS